MQIPVQDKTKGPSSLVPWLQQRPTSNAQDRSRSPSDLELLPPHAPWLQISLVHRLTAFTGKKDI